MFRASIDDSCHQDIISTIDDVHNLDTQMPTSPAETTKPTYDAAVEESQLAQWKPSLFKAATKTQSLKRPTKGKLTPGVRVKSTSAAKRSIPSSVNDGNKRKRTEPCATAERLPEAETYLFDNLELTTDQVHQWDAFQDTWKDMPWIHTARAVGDALRALIKYLLLTCVTLSPTSVSEARDMYSCKTYSTLEMLKILISLWNNYTNASHPSGAPAANTERTPSFCFPITPSPASITSTPTTSAHTQRVGVVVPFSATFLRIDPGEELMTSISSQLPTGEISSSIMWEQDGRYYTLKSGAISGSQRVDITVFPRERLMTATDPRQRWRLASSRLKVWIDESTPEGAELLALSLDLQQRVLRLISKQDDCQKGQGSLT